MIRPSEDLNRRINKKMARHQNLISLSTTASYWRSRIRWTRPSIMLLFGRWRMIIWLWGKLPIRDVKKITHQDSRTMFKIRSKKILKNRKVHKWAARGKSLPAKTRAPWLNSEPGKEIVAQKAWDRNSWRDRMQSSWTQMPQIDEWPHRHNITRVKLTMDPKKASES